MEYDVNWPCTFIPAICVRYFVRLKLINDLACSIFFFYFILRYSTEFELDFILYRFVADQL